MLLAGDVGGTNARLALGREAAPGRVELVARRRVRVADHPDVVTPLAAFVRDEAPAGETIAACCLGIAGTVDDPRRVSGVNLSWVIEAEAIERAVGVERAVLINDFQAAARGLEQLGEGDVVALGGGSPEPGEPIALLGAGTGLGQAFLISTSGGDYRVISSEGGHRDFAPCDPLQDRLLVYLRARFGRVSTERVLSGPGLVNVYAFLVEAEGLPAAPAVTAALAADPATAGPVISAEALAGREPTCVEALRVFVEVYGAEAGNVALTVLARGGVYIAGGIAPHVLTREEPKRAFRKAFVDKGRFRDWLEGLAVRVVTTDELGLLGAAGEALRLARGAAGS